MKRINHRPWPHACQSCHLLGGVLVHDGDGSHVFAFHLGPPERVEALELDDDGSPVLRTCRQARAWTDEEAWHPGEGA